MLVRYSARGSRGVLARASDPLELYRELVVGGRRATIGLLG